MKFIADFHIHSPFSRATSKELVPENIACWSKIKGINLVGSGDFTHPGWFRELSDKLEPAEEGFYALKKEYEKEVPALVREQQVRFFLTTEISSIYKKNGKVRKIHNLICVPDFDTATRITNRLLSLGLNLSSDGRPIVGLDAKTLLEITLESSDQALFIPAHIWTPWFSLLGSKSGFDSLEECFEDLSPHIYAVETGLSSDIPMNRICSILDPYALISNSDAHSPEKLGRNANIFDTEFSYPAIRQALQDNNGKTFQGTIDMFPQEGKYHYDGHRKCNLAWSPLETLAHREKCPECGRNVTVGVLNRIASLSDRDEYESSLSPAKFYYAISLKEILSELTGVGPSSKKVAILYHDYIEKYGNELSLLLEQPLEHLEQAGDTLLAEALYRMREKRVVIQEGYDGEYGKISVFNQEELAEVALQDSLLGSNLTALRESKPQRRLVSFDLNRYQSLKTTYKEIRPAEEDEALSEKEEGSYLDSLNEAQYKAVTHEAGPLLIVAGPGTGKTRTLIARIVHLVTDANVSPEHIVALTFTNKAAREIKERLLTALPAKVTEHITVATFHSLGYSVLQKFGHKLQLKENFTLLDTEDRARLVATIMPDTKTARHFLERLGEIKQNLLTEADIQDEQEKEYFRLYQEQLAARNLVDLDDLLYRWYYLLKQEPEVYDYCKARYQWVMVDEYQDLNYAQYMLLRLLKPEKDANLCIIGDPDQAIYGFRGADVSYIQRFTDDYPDAALYLLQQSYRCSDIILQASSQVLRQHSEPLLQGVGKGVTLKIVPQKSDKSEAEYIARQIQQMIGGVSFFSIDSNVTDGSGETDQLGLSDFAILCRVKSQMNSIEKALQDHAIPYQVAGRDAVFESEPVKTIIQLLQLACGKESALADATVSALYQQKFADITSYLAAHRVEESIQYIADSMDMEFKGRQQAMCTHLLDFSASYKNDYKGFLRDITLGVDQDLYDALTEKVTIMTMHASKGLEFETVFVPGCEEKIIPYALYENHTADVEEEKRLLYVAMTRAKKYLHLLHVENRYINNMQLTLPRSRFLDTIEKELYEIQHAGHAAKTDIKEDTDQLTLFQ